MYLHTKQYTILVNQSMTQVCVHYFSKYLYQVYIYTFYCSLQSVYASSLFTSRLFIMNHRFWGCISRLSIHLVICHLLYSVYTSSIRTAGLLLHSLIHMVHILCYSLSQDQTTMPFNCYLRPVQELKLFNFYIQQVQDQVSPFV